MSNLTDDERLNLKHLMKEMDYVDNTETIRRLKHSTKIRSDIIMSKLLIVLKLIEDGQIEQQDGSVRVGRLLKELYLDSAVKRADALDKEHNKEKPVMKSGKEISWKKYKQVGMPKLD